MRLSGLRQPERDVSFLFLVPHGTFLNQCQFTTNNTSNTASLCLLGWVISVCLHIYVCVGVCVSKPAARTGVNRPPSVLKSVLGQLSAPALTHTLAESFCHWLMWFFTPNCDSNKQLVWKEQRRARSGGVDNTVSFLVQLSWMSTNNLTQSAEERRTGTFDLHKNPDVLYLACGQITYMTVNGRRWRVWAQTKLRPVLVLAWR